MTVEPLEEIGAHRRQPVVTLQRPLGRGISALVVLFMAFDGMTKVATEQHVLVCTAVYVIPRMSVLGAILLTGFLGGATPKTLP